VTFDPLLDLVTFDAPADLVAFDASPDLVTFDVPSADPGQLNEQPLPPGQEYRHSNTISDPPG
jgi:hypothetical protein